MRLKKYLIEGRSKRYTDIDEIGEIMKQYCTEAIEAYKNGNWIYRASNTTGPYLLTQPKGDRKSAYSIANFYTIGINNHPMGEDFPKREVICTTSTKRAEIHGAENIYHVFPFDGAFIGICSEGDIGDSFGELEEKGANADELNEFLASVLEVDDLEWMEFKETAQNLSPEDVNIKNLELTPPGFRIGEDWKESGMNLYSFLTELLDPRANNFRLKQISNFSAPSDREVGTDSNCVLLDYEDEDVFDLFDELGI